MLDYNQDDLGVSGVHRRRDATTTRSTTHDDGRLLAQSPGLESLGLHYTPDEVAEFRDAPGPARRADRSRPTSPVDAASSPRLRARRTSCRSANCSIASTERWRASTDCCCGRSWAVWRCAAVAGRWLAGRALAPLSRLAVATQRIGITNLHDRLSVRGADDELDQVAQAFNHALARVEHSVGEMRQFSAALAHELRTPLAILRGEAELALTQPSSSDEAPASAREPDRRIRSADSPHQSDPDAGAEPRAARSRWPTRAGRSVGARCIGGRADRAGGRRARASTLTCDIADGVMVERRRRMAGAAAADPARQRHQVHAAKAAGSR